jgi:ectoine hydroxylase
MPAPAALNGAILRDDFDHDNGPLRVVPGSNRLGLLTPTGAGQRESRGWQEHVSADLTYTVPDRAVAGLLAGGEPEPLVGPAGTVYAFHPSIVHSSARNTSDRRRSMLVITYNAVSNVPAHPNRPEFLVGRETGALSPLAVDSLRVADPSSRGVEEDHGARNR